MTRFPSPQDVQAAVEGLPDDPASPYRLQVGPGAVTLRKRKWQQVHATTRDGKPFTWYRTGHERDARHSSGSRGPTTGWHPRSRTRLAHRLGMTDLSPLWSNPARRPVLVTLTWPGQNEDGQETWSQYAPGPAAVQGSLQVFYDVLRNTFGRAQGTWKLEFQRRGAPHLHLLLALPQHFIRVEHFDDDRGQLRTEWLPDGLPSLSTAPGYVMHPPVESDKSPSVLWAFKNEAGTRGVRYFVGTPVQRTEWLSEVWHRILCRYPDTCGTPQARLECRRHLAAGTAIDWAESDRLTDPVATAIYVTAHSLPGQRKGYQHQLPDEWRGPDGEFDRSFRFWGLWGLDRLTADVGLSEDQFVQLRRALRSHYRAVRARGRQPASVVRPDGRVQSDPNRPRGKPRRVTRQRVNQRTGEIRSVRRRVHRRPRLRSLQANAGATLLVRMAPAFVAKLVNPPASPAVRYDHPSRPGRWYRPARTGELP